MLEGKFICTEGFNKHTTKGKVYEARNGRIRFDNGSLSSYSIDVSGFNRQYVSQLAPYEEPHAGIVNIDLTNFDLDEFMVKIFKQVVQMGEPSIKPAPKPTPSYESFTFTYSDANNDITHTMTEETCDYDLKDVVATFVNFLKGVGFADDDIGDYIDVDML